MHCQIHANWSSPIQYPRLGQPPRGAYQPKRRLPPLHSEVHRRWYQTTNYQSPYNPNGLLCRDGSETLGEI